MTETLLSNERIAEMAQAIEGNRPLQSYLERFEIDPALCHSLRAAWAQCSVVNQVAVSRLTDLHAAESENTALREQLARETERADGNFTAYDRIKGLYSDTVNKLAQVEKESIETKQHRHDLIEGLRQRPRTLNQASERMTFYQPRKKLSRRTRTRRER